MQLTEKNCELDFNEEREEVEKKGEEEEKYE